jgi:hypothetical protein
LTDTIQSLFDNFLDITTRLNKSNIEFTLDTLDDTHFTISTNSLDDNYTIPYSVDTTNPLDITLTDPESDTITHYQNIHHFFLDFLSGFLTDHHTDT